MIERAQLVMEQNVVEDAKTAAEINRIITLMYAEIAKEIFAFMQSLLLLKVYQLPKQRKL